MKGTEKQIKWAEDIKANAFANIECCRKYLTRFNGNENLAGYSAEDINEAEAKLRAVLEKFDDASWIINHRGTLIDMDKVVNQIAAARRHNAK